MSQQIGVLHPGDMGISLAVAAQQSGHQVYWASEGRSAQTHARAAAYGLIDTGTLAGLCVRCAVIVSVCPPHAAEELARQVIAQGYRGYYLDANAIAPERAQRIAQLTTEAGMTFIDGGIIGGPAWRPGETWLYLSGPQAEAATAWLGGGLLETAVIGAAVGKASALKMCYAAYSKGTTALLSAILAAAQQLDVSEELGQQWARDDPQFAAQAAERVQKVTAKAWRFAGEMEEIAATFCAAGVPPEFHRAAAAVYRRMAHFKDARPAPPLDAILAALRQPDHE